MHEDEVDIDAPLVRRLVAAQFPQWADLPVEPVRSAGTVNAIYRLGDDLAVRLPRVPWGVADVDRERQWLPRLAPHLPLDVPAPVGSGTPNEDYPFPWSVYRWLPGVTATVERLADPRRAAVDLGNFVVAMRRIDPTGAPRSGRSGPLADRDRDLRAIVDSLRDTIDPDAAIAVWEAALAAPAWPGPPVWVHGDLLPGNLLTRSGRLSAVIDFGGAGLGDPACDVMAAWTFLSAETRAAFRAVVRADDATWARARGWALSLGLFALPYYQVSNPAFAATAHRIVTGVLTDSHLTGS
jgi:aminoglycoside phosphotransferase (APT) family kinase protein